MLSSPFPIRFDKLYANQLGRRDGNAAAEASRAVMKRFAAAGKHVASHSQLCAGDHVSPRPPC
jgi:hypothetical protein